MVLRLRRLSSTSQDLHHTHYGTLSLRQFPEWHSVCLPRSSDALRRLSHRSRYGFVDRTGTLVIYPGRAIVKNIANSTSLIFIITKQQKLKNITKYETIKEVANANIKIQKVFQIYNQYLSHCLFLELLELCLAKAHNHIIQVGVVMHFG